VNFTNNEMWSVPSHRKQRRRSKKNVVGGLGMSVWVASGFTPSSSTGEPGTSVSIVSGYGLDDWAIGVRYLAKAKRFFV
jgi:hypothetical protein